MVSGLLPTVLVGILGALFSELIRVAGAFREGKPPKGNDLIASGIFIVLGAGAALYGWDSPKAVLEVATLGAAFPLVFSAAIRAAVPKGAGQPAPYANGGAGRTVWDYAAGRF